ncbi:PucR family transcriptional regulator [Streptomyces sp. NRRL S-340]|uniref:PucR family transcriptional regulator n=1 Tax=Streptomyces sp. NRRL S-340 TaxID=1463901 RepID=UPI000562C93C|nr:helix-turn-helix domain-containing protein [Streptomyces sp. NRRL S-340]
MDREPTPHPGGPTLAHLLTLAGPGLLDVVAAPLGTDVPVADVTVHDVGEERDDGWTAPGHVLLTPGTPADSPEAVDVLRAAERAGAAALVLRPGARRLRTALAEAAAQGRTALLIRSPDTGWTEVLGRLRTALVAGDATAPPPADGLRLGDLAGLANTVADLVGGAITIEDPRSRVLAYSRLEHGADPLRTLTILGQEVPRWRVAELRERGFFQALWSSGDVVRLPADDRYAERLAIAVQHGGEVLGSLWAAADGRPLAADAAAALRTAARAAVPHLVHHETCGREEAGRREQAVRDLLEGRPGAQRTARALGVPPEGPYTLLVVEVHGTRDPAGPAPTGPTGTGRSRPAAPAGAPPGDATGHRVLDMLALQAAAYLPGCVTTRSDGRLFVLVSTPGGAGANPARRLAATVRSLPHSVVFAGAGRQAADLSEVAASRASAELVVRVLRERAARAPGGSPASACAAYQEVAAEAALLQVLDRIEPLWQGTPSPVHAMVAHDRAHGSAYGDSVAAYLAEFGDTRAAALSLNVHPNTLRYRLRRARELFGVDVSDPAGRLLADLGLRLARRDG